MTTGTVRTVALDKLKPDPHQVRKNFDKEGLRTLADNLKQRGILTPLLVREVGKSLVIVDGERRWRAAKLARLKTVPIVVRQDEGDVQRKLDQVAVNSLREPLKPLELGRLLVDLRKTHKLSDNQIAAHLDKQNIPALSKTQMVDLMRLVDLPEWAQDMVDQGHVPAPAAKVISVARSDPRVEAGLGVQLRQAIGYRGRLTEHDVSRELKGAYRRDKDTRDLTREYGYGREEQTLVVHFDTMKACAGCEHLRVIGRDGRYCRNPKHFNELNDQAKEAGLLPGGKKPSPQKKGAETRADNEAAERRAEQKEKGRGQRLAEHLDAKLREHLITEVLPAHSWLREALKFYLSCGMPHGKDHAGRPALLLGSWGDRRMLRHLEDEVAPSGLISLMAFLDPKQDVVIMNLAKAAIRMLRPEQVHALARHMDVRLRALALIDSTYLAILSLEDLKKLARLGGIGEAGKMTGKAIKVALLDSPEAIARIGVPAELAALYDQEPAPPPDHSHETDDDDEQEEDTAFDGSDDEDLEDQAA